MAKVSGAQRFALYCEEQGWKVERVVEGDLKRVEARKDGALVTAEWEKEAALGPYIGHYTPAGGGMAIGLKNAAEARRVVDGSKIPEPPKPRKAPSSHPKPRKDRTVDSEPEPPREIKSNLDFDPYELDDDDVLDLLCGNKVTWQDQYGYQSARVPTRKRTIETRVKQSDGSFKTISGRVTNENIKITVSRNPETEGERIFNFCSPDSGYRAFFIGSLVRIN
jgi:hypothetical protein